MSSQKWECLEIQSLNGMREEQKRNVEIGNWRAT